MFQSYDTSGEGTIDSKELGVMLRAMGLFATEAEVQDIIVVVDSDGSGKLDFKEFVNLMTSRFVISLFFSDMLCESPVVQVKGHGLGNRGSRGVLPVRC